MTCLETLENNALFLGLSPLRIQPHAMFLHRRHDNELIDTWLRASLSSFEICLKWVFSGLALINFLSNGNDYMLLGVILLKFWGLENQAEVFRGIRYWRRYKARRPIAFLPVCCEFCCQNVSFNIFFKLIWKYKQITKRIHLVCMCYPHCLTTHEGSQCVPSALPINNKYIRKWKIILAIEKKSVKKSALMFFLFWIFRWSITPIMHQILIQKPITIGKVDSMIYESTKNVWPDKSL